jgi:hypothetical protein
MNGKDIEKVSEPVLDRLLVLLDDGLQASPAALRVEVPPGHTEASV